MPTSEKPKVAFYPIVCLDRPRRLNPAGATNVVLQALKNEVG